MQALSILPRAADRKPSARLGGAQRLPTYGAMPAIRVSAQLQPQHSDWPAMRRAWVEAEELGVDCLFNWDHFFPLSGDPDGKHFEALTTLGAMAEVTERVELGSLVICNSYRNPDYLAAAIRTIDHISGGRVILGIGAGWFQRDYDEYGYDFGTVGERITALGEALPRIERRFGKLNPPPLREHVPILIGGGGVRRTLRLVARHADIWHAFGNADVFREKSAILDEHCAAVGRDPAAIERSWSLGSHDPDALRDAGVTHFVVGISGSASGYDLGQLRELVAWRDGLA
jgi:probable F420-dependent oxidoreductase